MMNHERTRGRPKRFRHLDAHYEALKNTRTLRPSYCDGIGIHIGAKRTSAYVKIQLRHRTLYKGTMREPGKSIEINLGQLSSWSWDALTKERDRLQGLADRGEALEATEEETFRDFSTRWIVTRADTLRGMATTKSHLNKHLLPAFGDSPIGEISVASINKWQAERLKSAQPGTVKRERATLSTILQAAFREGQLEINPVNRAEKIRGDSARTRLLGKEEIGAIISAASAIDEEANTSTSTTPIGWRADFLRWALLTGMRKQEILNLRRRDLSCDGDELKWVSIDNTKTNRPRRQRGSKALTEIANRQLNQVELDGASRLFNISKSTLTRGLNAVFSRSGVKDVRLHDFRRAHASYLIEDGVPIAQVANQLGHTNWRMLEKHYVQHLDSGKASESASQQFDNFI